MTSIDWFIRAVSMDLLWIFRRAARSKVRTKAFTRLTAEGQQLDLIIQACVLNLNNMNSFGQIWMILSVYL